MAYDVELADRVRALLADETDLTERAMFGGLGFMLAGTMAVAAASGGQLMVRVDPRDAPRWVDGEAVRPMRMGERTMRGWVLVAPEAMDTDAALQQWLDRGVARARSLPAK